MTDDATAPATKQDIAMLMEEFGKMWIWKGEMEEKMLLWKQELREEIFRGNKEMKEHFDLVAENMHHDMRAAHREEIEVLKDRSKDHGKRIGRLEQAVGLAA